MPCGGSQFHPLDPCWVSTLKEAWAGPRGQLGAGKSPHGSPASCLIARETALLAPASLSP